MTSTVRGAGGKAKVKCYWVYGVGVSEYSGRPIFIFLLNKIGFFP